MVGMQFVNLAEANFFPLPTPLPAVFIRSDGSVDPPEAPIQRAGEVYTFTDDIVGYTIAVERDNIVIDGGGYSLQGSGNSTGIFLQERNNVSVKNMKIRNFSYGIRLYAVPGTGSSGNNVSGNNITKNTIGIWVGFSSGNNVISGNTITENDYGISIAYSSNNVLRNNQMNNNKYNFWVGAEVSIGTSSFVHDVDTSNTVDGKPIYYWVNQRDRTVPSDAGYVALINCTSITVQNLKLAHNGQGILLVSTNNSLITKNYIINNGYGIMLYGAYVPCAYNHITENRITENTEDGIHQWGGHDDTITKNYITNNQKNGINSFDSRYNTIVGNNITANKDNGIKLWGFDSNKNVVSENYIANNENGITLDTSFNNNIIGNSIIANKGWGIILAYTSVTPFSNNKIYHNNFVNDQQAVYTVDEFLPPLPPATPATDNWDNDFEGNYWSDYNGTDNNRDGIGDTPYIINANNQDRYPLMKPVAIPPIVIPEFHDEENPTVPTEPSTELSPDQQPGFLGSSLPMEYGYGIVAAVGVAVVAVTGYLFFKRKGSSTATETSRS